MKTALLLCDHVNPEYRAEFGNYREMFLALFPELQFTFYDVINGHFPENPETYDLFMTTGSRHSAYEDLDWILKVKALIRNVYEAQKFFVGVCFGHQLLGEAMGGKVEKSQNGWCVGVHEFEIYESKDWMQPKHNPLNLLMMCQDQVVKLPPGASVLAGNESCPVGVFQIGNTMLGIQAHPEFSKAYDQRLIELRRERIGEDTVRLGLKSLEKEVHRKAIHDWVIKFINGGR